MSTRVWLTRGQVLVGLVQHDRLWPEVEPLAACRAVYRCGRHGSAKRSIEDYATHVIKIISAANMHPTNRSRSDFFHYWRTLHGPLFARTPPLRRYVQHFSVDEAYHGPVRPTHDGASMFWYDDLDALRGTASPVLADAITPADGALYEHYVTANRYGTAGSMTLQETVRADDRQLFDRATDWPTSHRRATVVAHERVVVDGPTRPDMVKGIFIATRKSGLTYAEFFEHWFEVHGALCSRVPGLRRYVQNHAVEEAYPVRPMTHDGFSELWFDNLAAMEQARRSAEWTALSEDGQTLFSYPMAVVVAHEGVIKASGAYESRPTGAGDWDAQDGPVGRRGLPWRAHPETKGLTHAQARTR